MNKTIIAVIILALVGAALYFVLTRPAPAPEEPEVQGTAQMGEDREVSGPVTMVDTSGIAADGPYRVTVQTLENELVTVAIPSMGLPLCAAKEAIADPNTIAVGQMLEVRGVVGDGGEVIPCESAEHYVRIVPDVKG